MCATAQRLPDVLGQRADVRALRATDLDVDRAFADVAKQEFVDRDRPGLSLDHNPILDGGGAAIAWTLVNGLTDNRGLRVERIQNEIRKMRTKCWLSIKTHDP